MNRLNSHFQLTEINSNCFEWLLYFYKRVKKQLNFLNIGSNKNPEQYLFSFAYPKLCASFFNYISDNSLTHLFVKVF